MDERNEILENIQSYKEMIVNSNAMVFEYDSWSDDFKLKKIMESYKKFCDMDVDFRKFTKKELISVGFSNWDDDLILMPLWAYHICKKGLKLTSISGDISVKGEDYIDTDVRFGCIAWGFTTNELIKRERKIKLEKIDGN